MKIIIADRYALFREGLKSLLEQEEDISVVAEAASGDVLLELAQRHYPDIIIMEYELVDGCGLSCMKSVLASHPNISFLILDNNLSDEQFFDVLVAGAKGVLKKSVSRSVLVASLRALERGEAIIPRKMVTLLLNELSKSRTSEANSAFDLSVLTDRELEIIKLMGLYLSNREIADRLAISENTVRVHVHNILEKLNLRSRKEATELAVRSRALDYEAAED